MSTGPTDICALQRAYIVENGRVVKPPSRHVAQKNYLAPGLLFTIGCCAEARRLQGYRFASYASEEFQDTHALLIADKFRSHCFLLPIC